MPRRILSLILLAVVAALSLGVWAHGTGVQRPRRLDLARVPARRADLDLSILANGRVESSSKTMIECEVQNLAFLGTGRDIIAGASSILEVVDEGSFVKKGDVICVLDSSDFEEMVIAQELRVQEARNEYEKGLLDVKAAEIALAEYRDGLLPQQLQEIESQIVLAESDLRRQTERLDWTRQMVRKQYLSEGQFLAEENQLLRAQTTLKYQTGQSDLLRDHKSPVAILRLEVALEQARSTLSFQELSLSLSESQLEKYRKQVEFCTIRAPHDGMLIYSQDWGMKIEVGLRVYQKMPLFNLPDLSTMEIETELNEAFVNRIKPDMKSRVKIDALPGESVDGHVVRVSTLPMLRQDLLSLLGMSDVRSYTAMVQLHSAPKGLLPGMTAEVEIITGHREGAIVVPAESLVTEDGEYFCVVDGEDGLERREVQVGGDAHDLVEVEAGLSEGEKVLHHPSLLTTEEMEQISSRPVSLH